MESATATAHRQNEETLVPTRATFIFYIVIGTTSVVAGLLAIVYPDTLAALSIILGIELVLLGSLELADAANEEDGTARALQAVLALVAVIAGVIVLRRPAEALVVVLLAAGLYMIVAGLVSVVRAVVNIRYRAPAALGGLAMLVVGIVIVAWPDITLRTLAVLIGVGLIVRGVTALGVAFVVRVLRTEPAN